MTFKSEIISKSSYSLLDYTTTSSIDYIKTQHGDAETRIKQLTQQVEQLSLSNAKLLRSNRMLKLDIEKLIEEKTMEVTKALKSTIEQNIRLQRANRLLKQDIDHKTEELNQYKQEDVHRMKHCGPEYEYLVQVVHLLYRQLSDKPKCDQTCCFTNQSAQTTNIDNNNTVHLCRPTIHSNTTTGRNMTVIYEKENRQLKDSMDILIKDRDALYELLKNKEQDNETLKYELKVKDDIVKQLENDFEKLELQVSDLQKEWYSPADSTTFSEIHSFPTVPTSI